MKLSGTRLWCAVIAALLGACSPPSAKGTIGAAGGTVSASNGNSIVVPPGALATDTAVTLEPTSDTTATGWTTVGTPYVLGPEGTTFAQPVTVTLAFSPQSLPAGAQTTDVVIVTAPVGSNAFASLGGTLSDATHVEATTGHFSVFVPAVADPDAGPALCPIGTWVRTVTGAGACDGGTGTNTFTFTALADGGLTVTENFDNTVQSTGCGKFTATVVAAVDAGVVRFDESWDDSGCTKHTLTSAVLSGDCTSLAMGGVTTFQGCGVCPTFPTCSGCGSASCAINSIGGTYTKQ